MQREIVLRSSAGTYDVKQGPEAESLTPPRPSPELPGRAGHSSAPRRIQCSTSGRWTLAPLSAVLAGTQICPVHTGDAQRDLSVFPRWDLP